MDEIYIKSISSSEMAKKLAEIGFDKCYIEVGKNKYQYKIFKIHNLTPPAANILKQTALSVGTDCAVNKEVITCNIEKSDCILSGNISQLKQISEKLTRQPFGLKKLSQLINEQLENSLFPIQIRNKTFDWEKEKYLMGILNITPDSFSDGGKYQNIDKAIQHAQQLIKDGADIIDIGGESTRPFSLPIDSVDEQKRILPVIKELRKLNKDIVISVDTRNADTAQKVIEHGADIINDVSLGEYDKNMLEFVAEAGVPYVLTHTKGTPENMQNNPQYKNVVDDVYKDLQKKILFLNELGFSKKKLIVDIGLGFGKTVEHNFELIRNLDDFKSLGCPLLVGHSRKSFLKEINSDIETATQVLSLYLLSTGANILRVHNVRENLIPKNLAIKLT